MRPIPDAQFWANLPLHSVVARGLSIVVPCHRRRDSSSDVERSRLFLRPLTAIDDGCLRARSYGVDGDEHGEWKGERG